MGDGLQRAWAATHGVKIGQLWQDNDPRYKKVRTLRIDELWVNSRGELRARCHVLETGRAAFIAVRRFKPTSTGYRLVKEAPPLWPLVEETLPKVF
jgi:hypothetical protein